MLKQPANCGDVISAYRSHQLRSLSHVFARWCGYGPEWVGTVPPPAPAVNPPDTLRPPTTYNRIRPAGWGQTGTNPLTVDLRAVRRRPGDIVMRRIPTSAKHRGVIIMLFPVLPYLTFEIYIVERQLTIRIFKGRPPLSLK